MIKLKVSPKPSGERPGGPYSREDLMRFGIPPEKFKPDELGDVSRILLSLETSIEEMGLPSWPTMYFGLDASSDAIQDVGSLRHACDRLAGLNKTFKDFKFGEEVIAKALPACKKAIKDTKSLDAVFDRLEAVARGDMLKQPYNAIVLEDGLDATQNAITSSETLDTVLNNLSDFIKRMEAKGVHPHPLIAGTLKASSKAVLDINSLSRTLECIEKAEESMPGPDFLKSLLLQNGFLSCSESIQTVHDIPKLAEKVGALGGSLFKQSMGWAWIFMDYLPDLKEKGIMSSDVSPWVLDNAYVMASHGIDPSYFLLASVPSLAELGLLKGGYLGVFSKWTSDLASIRINPADVYSHTVPAIACVIDSPDALDSVSSKITKLCRTLTKGRINPHRTTCYGFSSIKGSGLCTRELIHPILDLSQVLAEACVDPYDTLHSGHPSEQLRAGLPACAREGLVKSPDDISEVKSFFVETCFIPLVPELFRVFKGKTPAERVPLVAAWRDRVKGLVREGEVNVRDRGELALGFASLGHPEELTFEGFCETLQRNPIEPQAIALPTFEVTVSLEEPVHARVNKGVIRKYREPLVRVDDSTAVIRLAHDILNKPKEHGLDPARAELSAIRRRFSDIAEGNAVEVLATIAPLTYVTQMAFPSPRINETALQILQTVTWYSEDASHLLEPIRRYSPEASPSEVRDTVFALHEFYSDHMLQGRRFTLEREFLGAQGSAGALGDRRMRDFVSKLRWGVGEWTCSVLEDELSGRRRVLEGVVDSDGRRKAEGGIHQVEWELSLARDIVGRGGDLSSDFEMRARGESGFEGDALKAQESIRKIRGIVSRFGSRMSMTPLQDAIHALDWEVRRIESRTLGAERVCLVPSKRSLDLCFGFVGEDSLKGRACALRDPRFVPYRMVGEGERLTGMIYPVFCELDGRKVLVVAGIQPRRKSRYNARDLVHGILDGFRDNVAIPGGFDCLLMPDEPPYQSNKIDVKSVIAQDYLETFSFNTPLVFPLEGAYRLVTKSFIRVWERKEP